MIYPTIQINDPKKPGDYLIIAERDFDPKRHTRFGEAAAKAEPAAVKAETPAPKPRARRKA